MCRKLLEMQRAESNERKIFKQTSDIAKTILNNRKNAMKYISLIVTHIKNLQPTNQHIVATFNSFDKL